MRLKNLACILGVMFALFAMERAATAQAVDVQGVASLESKSAKLKPVEQEQLKQMAMLSALGRFSASFSNSRMALFSAKKAEIEADIGSYFIDLIVVDESYDKAAKRHSLVVRGTLNQAKLDLAMSGVQTPTTNSGPKISISFFFVARETSSVKEFQTRETRVTEAKSAASSSESISASQSSGISAQQAALQEKTEKAGAAEATAVVTTGGSDLKQSDKVTYTVSSPENINAAMLDVFTSGGFEVFDYKDVSSNCNGRDPVQIYPEFAASDEMSAETRKVLFDAARSCDVNAFAVGTLDIGLQDVDPATGNKRVFVSVRSQVYSLAGKLPRAIASVGPVQYAGLGPDQAVASRNALQEAAKEVATNIAAQLRARGL